MQLLNVPLVLGLLVPKEIPTRDLEKIRLLFADAGVDTGEELEFYSQDELQFILKDEYEKILLGSWENVRFLCTTLCGVIIRSEESEVPSPKRLVRLLGEVIQIVQSRPCVETAKSKGYTLAELADFVKALKYTRLGAYQMSHGRFGAHTLECLLSSGYILGIMGCDTTF